MDEGVCLSFFFFFSFFSSYIEEKRGSLDKLPVQLEKRTVLLVETEGFTLRRRKIGVESP